MATKFVPYSKLSKRKRKEVDRLRRGDSIPATKVVADRHKETRQREIIKSQTEDQLSWLEHDSYKVGVGGSSPPFSITGLLTTQPV